MKNPLFLLMIISALPCGVAAETQPPAKWFPLKSVGLSNRKPAEIAAMPGEVAYLPLNRSAVRTNVKVVPALPLRSSAAGHEKSGTRTGALDTLQAQQIHDIFNIQ